MNTSETTLDLTNCDREKIHQITYIQGHGAFVAVSARDMRIRNASENLPAFFQHAEPVEIFIGKKLNEVINNELSLTIQEKLKSNNFGPMKQGRIDFKSGIRLDIFLFHLHDDVYGIEFEKLEEDPIGNVPPEEILNHFVQKMQESKSLAEISKEACKAVRKLTNLERVMIYKFFPPTMYGEVIAEDKVASAHTFMNHRFPATDIPKPARDLYLRNHVRFIFDSQQTDFEIYPRIEDKKFVPLDMSDSRLRGVSKIHLEYLKNMGVRSSFSVAIIVDDQLWGLISCHHSGTVNISHSVRAMCETISRTLALGASMFEKMSVIQSELSFFNRLHELFGKLKNSDDPMDQLFREGSRVLELFNCTGMILVSRDKIDLFGLTPLPDDIKKIWGWLLAKMDDENKIVVCTDSLATMRPEFASMKDTASGILALRFSEIGDCVLILTRAEFLEKIFWGGDPRKNIEARNYNGIINPRESFKTWEEVISNASVHWEKHEVKGVEFFKNLIFDSLIHKEQLIQELQEKMTKR